MELTESPLVNEWMRQAAEERALRTLRHALVTFLEGRFPGAVPNDVLETIESQPSLPLLDEWVHEAGKAPTIEAFRAYLRR